MPDITDSLPLSLEANSLASQPADGLTNPLTLLLPMIIAMIISMMLIPVMVRLAPALGLIDRPDARKVHSSPVPRVGGFGIFFGAMLPLILLLPLDHELTAFLAGALVLFVFGVLDDSLELGHYAKFIGQFIAVIIVVYWGNIYVTHFPLLQDGVIGESAGRLFTVIAMVGMINAINHSDGLDGLAGGEAMLSLCCIAWLAFLANGMPVAMISLALVGGLLGFMRYNTHPAVIFMGDGGSQFIGFTLGFLAVMLTQRVNTVLSPALPALILGLPVADIIGVFVQRIYHRMNWFRATRNHIHHRLLDLGFFHHESVVIIYSIQTLLVACAALMPYERDGLVLGLYLVIVAIVFLSIYIAERKGWKTNAEAPSVKDTGIRVSARIGNSLAVCSYWLLAIGLSVFLLAGSVFATRIPPEFTMLAMVLCGLLLVRLLVPYTARFLPVRVLSYMAIIFVVYLFNTNQPDYLKGAEPVTYIYFCIMVIGIAVAIRFSGKGNFELTPTDFLVLVAVFSLAILSSRSVVDSTITAVTLKAIVLFYACELVLNRIQYRWNLFTVSTLAALAVISARGMGLMK